MADSKCAQCDAPCSKDQNDGDGWHCNCVHPCPHSDQGSGWYVTTRRERIVKVVDAIYYVWADSPGDALARLQEPTFLRTAERAERAIQQTVRVTVEPESDWSPPHYDYNEGMGR